YFAALQCVLARTVRWLTDRWALALIGVGLLMMTLSPFRPAGGLTDFRVDFSVFCLFGILVCAVLRSELFLSLRWSLVVGVIAALVVLTRSITVLYIVAIFGALLLFFCFQRLRNRNSTSRQTITARLRGFVAAAAVFVLLSIPVLWYSRESFLAYY